MSARVSIVVFPGSNCELDVQTAFRGLGADAQLVWHAEEKLSDTDIVVLPGAMRKNAGLKFRCMWTDLRVETSNSPFTSATSVGDTLRIPINHFEGNWYCESRELERLQGNGQIVFRYVDNPNGSLDDVAGIVNADRNVLGMMPHPERACETLLGSADGARIFSSMLDHIRERDAVSV